MHSRSTLSGLSPRFSVVLIVTIGLDPVIGTPRFTFGLVDLMSGFNMVAVLIGFFCILRTAQRGAGDKAQQPQYKQNYRDGFQHQNPLSAP